MEHERQLIGLLAGEHAYDRGAQTGNWVAIWVFFVLSLALGGLAEAYMQGWKTIRATPFLAVVSALGLVGGSVWIITYNRIRYRVDSGSIERLAPRPRRSWKVWVEEIETAALEPSHGQWILALKLRDGRRRKIVLTKSMREALDLA